MSTETHLILGSPVDDQTRCTHYQTPLDIVAIRFHCCREFYPCHRCHQESAGHKASPWPVEEYDTPAVLCGVCQTELTIQKYLRVDACPQCGVRFNPGCRLHADLYFEPNA